MVRALVILRVLFMKNDINGYNNNNNTNNTGTTNDMIIRGSLCYHTSSSVRPNLNTNVLHEEIQNTMVWERIASRAVSMCLAQVHPYNILQLTLRCAHHCNNWPATTL